MNNALNGTVFLIVLLYYQLVKFWNLLQICKDKDAKPQIWEHVAPLKGLVRYHFQLYYIILFVNYLKWSWKTRNSVIWSFVHISTLHYLVEYYLKVLGHFCSSIFPVHFLEAIFRLFVIVCTAVYNFWFSILWNRVEMQSVKDSRLQSWWWIWWRTLWFIWLSMVYLCRAFIVNLGDMLERWSNCIFK